MTKLHRRHSCQSLSSTSNSSSDEIDDQVHKKPRKYQKYQKSKLNRVKSCPDSIKSTSPSSQIHIPIPKTLSTLSTQNNNTTLTLTPQPSVKPPTQPKKLIFAEICWTVARLLFFTLIFIIGIFLARYFSRKIEISNEIENIKNQLQNQRSVVAQINSGIRRENKISLDEYFESGDAMKPNSRKKRHVFEFERKNNNDEDADFNDFLGGKLQVAPTSNEKEEFKCDYGQFRVFDEEKKSCVSWLNCKDIKNEVKFDKSNILGRGMTKIAYLGSWRNKSVEKSVKNLKKKETLDTSTCLLMKFDQNCKECARVYDKTSK